MLIFFLLFLYVFAVIVLIHATVIDPPRRGVPISPRYAMIVILCLVYSVTMPIYTVGWLISKLF